MLVFRRFRFIAVLMALALVASACGGGDDDSSGGDATTTTAATPGGGGDVAADTTTTTQAEPVSGDSGSTWCDRIREFEDPDDSPIDFNFFGLTPEQLEAQFETNVEVYEDWARTAPSEIEDDVNVFLDAFRLLVDRAEALDWSLLALADDPEFITAFDNPAFEAAADNIDAYNRDVCGVDVTSIADPGAGPPPADVGDDPIAIALNAFNLPADRLREAVGPEFEANITSDWIPTQEQIAALLAAIGACGITLG